MTRYLIGLLVLLLVIASVVALTYRGNAANARTARDAAVTAQQSAEAERNDLKAALAAERKTAESLANIGQAHEEDRDDAQALPAAVVAGIDDGSLRLRRQWAACETSRVSETAAAAAERDALAELRKQDQGDLVRVGRDADDQVRACHATVAEYAP